jgi:hypothetical protein
MLWWLTFYGRQSRRREQCRGEGRPAIVVEQYRGDRAFQKAANQMAALGYQITAQGMSRTGGWSVTYQFTGRNAQSPVKRL